MNLVSQTFTTLRRRRKTIALLVTTGLIGYSTLPANAAVDTGVTISASTLGGGTVGFTSFSGVTLNGSAQTTTATWTLANVLDDRGSGAGWNLSLTLTQFAEYASGAYVSSGHTLPTSSVKVTTAPTVSQVDNTSSAANTITAVSTNTALDTGSAVKLLSAATGGGMGSFSFGSLTATLTVPANAYAATYKSDATVSLVTGP